MLGLPYAIRNSYGNEGLAVSVCTCKSSFPVDGPQHVRKMVAHGVHH